MLVALALVAAIQTDAPPAVAFEAAGGRNWDWSVNAGDDGFSLSETDGAFPTFRILAPPEVTRRGNVTRLETRTAAGAPVVLSIANEVCRSEGGSVYPYAASLEFDGRVRTGCAWGRVRHVPRDTIMLGDFNLHQRIAAQGTDPAWEARLGNGGANRLTIDGETFVEAPETLPSVNGTDAVYDLPGEDGRRLRATLRQRACEAEGGTFPFTIEVQAGQRRLSGCASQTYSENGPGIMSARTPRIRLLDGSIGAEDYPASALRDGASGRVRYEYLLNTDGRVAACAVRYSSGHTALDEATCALVLERFRYEPVRDASGEAIEHVGMANHEWTLPADR